MAGTADRREGQAVKKKAPARLSRLTAAEWKALEAVAKGADVFGYSIACTLRAIQLKAPSLIDIGDPAGDYDGASQMPYFGAITTKAGDRALRAKAEARDGR